MTEPPPGWERRKLGKYAFWLAVVPLLAVGVVFIFADDKLTAGSVLSSIGLNLVASVFFALVFSWLSGTIQERILLANLRDEYRDAAKGQADQVERLETKLESLSEGLFGRLAGYESTYMPEATYDASVEPESAFNRDIRESLSSTYNYAFRGTSAKFVPLRLRTSPRRNLAKLQIVMLDPESDKVLKARAAERVQQRRTDGRPDKSIDEVIRDIRDEILMSLVALFDQRHVCDMEIALVREPAVTRLEVFDDAIYLSWYRGPQSTEVPFPETFRFRRGSFMYQVYAPEIRRRYEVADQALRLHRDTEEDELMTFLGRLTGKAVGRDELDVWRRKYETFVKSVESAVRAA
jgi:hypothetical protein